MPFCGSLLIKPLDVNFTVALLSKKPPQRAEEAGGGGYCFIESEWKALC